MTEEKPEYSLDQHKREIDERTEAQREKKRDARETADRLKAGFERASDYDLWSRLETLRKETLARWEAERGLRSSLGYSSMSIARGGVDDAALAAITRGKLR